MPSNKKTYTLEASVPMEPEKLSSFQKQLKMFNRAVRGVQEMMFLLSGMNLKVGDEETRDFGPGLAELCSGKQSLIDACKRIFEYAAANPPAKLFNRFFEETNRCIVQKKGLLKTVCKHYAIEETLETAQDAIKLMKRALKDEHFEKVRTKIEAEIKTWHSKIQLESDIDLLRTHNIFPFPLPELFEIPDKKTQKDAFKGGFDLISAYFKKKKQMLAEVKAERKQTALDFKKVSKTIGKDRLAIIASIETELGYPITANHIRNLHKYAADLQKLSSIEGREKFLQKKYHADDRPGDSKLIKHLAVNPSLFDRFEDPCVSEEEESDEPGKKYMAICLYGWTNGRRIHAIDRAEEPKFSFTDYTQDISVKPLYFENSESKGDNLIKYVLGSNFEFKIEEPSCYEGRLQSKRLVKMLRYNGDSWEYRLLNDTWVAAEIKSIGLSYSKEKKRIYAKVPVEIVPPENDLEFIIDIDGNNTGYTIYQDEDVDMDFTQNKHPAPLLKNREELNCASFDFGGERITMAIFTLSLHRINAKSIEILPTNPDKGASYFMTLKKVRSLKNDYDKRGSSKRRQTIQKIYDLKTELRNGKDLAAVISEREAIIRRKSIHARKHLMKYGQRLWGLSYDEFDFQDADRKLRAAINSKEKELELPKTVYQTDFYKRKAREAIRVIASQMIHLLAEENCLFVMMERLDGLKVNRNNSRRINRMITRLRLGAFSGQLKMQLEKHGIKMMLVNPYGTSQINPFTKEFGMRCAEFAVSPASHKYREPEVVARMTKIKTEIIEELFALARNAGKQHALVPYKFGRILIDRNGKHIDADDAGCVNIGIRGLSRQKIRLPEGVAKEKKENAIMAKIKYLNSVGKKPPVKLEMLERAV